MQYTYKISTLTTIFILFLSFTSTGQFCLTIPSNLDAIEDCNRDIALAFAPRIGQWVSYCDSEAANNNTGTGGDSEGGDSDRLLRPDFDGDWVATNNWLNLENLDDPNFLYDVSPTIYYAVTWTPEVWIIVYTFYYARDWAKTGPGCNNDEHEGDFAKVFVVAKRATSQNQSPEDLLLGFKTTKEGEIEKCILTTEADVFDNNTTVSTSEIVEIAPGAHPRIYSAAGSHHCFTGPGYEGFVQGYNDDPGGFPATLNYCPPNPISYRLYYPASESQYVTNVLQPIEFDEGCYPGCDVDQGAIPIWNCSHSTEYYKIVDIFDEVEGIWAQRNNGNFFEQPETPSGTIDYYNQDVLCENGGGCPEKAPHAPWDGRWGLNPLEEIFENDFDEFNCDCNNNPNCEDFTITVCSYEYNPYLCEFYDIVMPVQFQYNGIWEDNPNQDNHDLVLAFRFSALDVPANADVTWCWELPAGFNNTVTCVGCTQTPVNICEKQGSSIVLKIANASIEDLTVDPEDFKVTATADFIECGTVEKEFTMQVQLKHIINNDTANCEKMVFEVKEAWHIDGNVYDWDFPLYDALASVSNGGRRVEFNTESVIQQTSPTTNPEKKLEYSLTVSNPSYTSEIEVNGEREIPDCRYGGLGLMVYPNPATDGIFLEFEGVQPNDETLDVHIFDHQFNRMGRELYALKGQSIDVTRLNNGLYFLCAVTKEGKMFTRKFCIGRH